MKTSSFWPALKKEPNKKRLHCLSWPVPGEIQFSALGKVGKAFHAAPLDIPLWSRSSGAVTTSVEAI